MPKVANVRYYTCLDGTVLRPGDDLPRSEVERAEKFGAASTEASSSTPGSADPIDSLTGEDLDLACIDAGVDIESGGSLADGSLSADEKREALKAERGAS